MGSFILIGTALYGFILLSFITLKIVFVLGFSAYKTFTNIILQHENFIQQVNLIGISRKDKFNLIRGEYYYDLDMAFLSAVETLDNENERKYFLERRQNLLKEIEKKMEDA